MKKNLLLGVSCLLAAAAGGAAGLLAPEAGSAYLYFRSRAGICTLRESLRSMRATLAQHHNFARMQSESRILERDPAGLDLYDTPRGRYWSPRGSENALFNQLAEQERAVYRAPNWQEIRPGDVVLDCGANIGLFTREALNRGASLVVAVEPSPENLACLRRNFVQEIRQARVIVYPKGVWDKDDILTLKTNPRNTSANSFIRTTTSEEGHVERVPLTTIDALVAELKLSRLDVIKMDIEGAEQKALLGGMGTLRRFKPRMAICVYHMPDDPVQVPRLVRQAVPDYRTGCGCLRHQDAVVPQVFHFF